VNLPISFTWFYWILKVQILVIESVFLRIIFPGNDYGSLLSCFTKKIPRPPFPVGQIYHFRLTGVFVKHIVYCFMFGGTTGPASMNFSYTFPFYYGRYGKW
jgi:hypothetical protein